VIDLNSAKILSKEKAEKRGQLPEEQATPGFPWASSHGNQSIMLRSAWLPRAPLVRTLVTCDWETCLAT